MVCRECKKKEPIKNFPYCADCLMMLNNKYRNMGDGAKNLSLWCLCAELNVAYIDSVAKKTVDITSYIKRLYSKSNAREFSESDSHLFEIFKYSQNAEQQDAEKDKRIEELHQQINELNEENKLLKNKIENLEEREQQIKQQSRDIDYDEAALTWGDNYTEEEYRLLDDIYNVYTCEIDKLTPAKKFRYQDVAKLELRRRQLGSNADPKESKTIADELKALYGMLGIGNFESDQKSDEEKFIDHLIWEIENTQPAENEDLNTYKNFSGLDDAVEEIQRCLFNAALGHKDYPNLGRAETDG